MYRLSKRSYNRLKGVEPILKDILKEAIKDAPFDFGVAWMGGHRTPAQQYKLFEKGASKCDGYKRKSYHQSGKAFDIVCYHNGAITWESHIFEMVANHILTTAKQKFNTRLTWGGNWQNFKDLPHFQLD